VVLQTFVPEHYVIKAAAGHDYDSFSKRELDYREKLGYPPFARLVRMEYRHKDNQQAEEEGRRMAEVLNNLIETQQRRATEMIGPVPCFYARRDGQYRWQIILRGPDPASMLVGQKLGEWRIETNPQALL
jgi:primosomal protein N' (replication factor Y)